ncbi:MAG: Radical domain protein [Aeromicrobium sp.]|uniref:MSMEG_0568 family radical SAM protein n=1 Tax=Aeromicrobium sp. TaxID=1871063 RepID=UPI00263020EA|nr:MSMEG_0568 family radical SAM protein [Aeromicrobium sp.]MCW2788671.1 Radical domain protein [Aeromicrobium sp.]MCW2825625.1 Radical domain protein [Aeromicrobium sp.]
MSEARESFTPLNADELAELIGNIQSHGLRVESKIERRRGGAGPSDAGMLWIDGAPTTAPTDAAYVQSSPYEMRHEDDGFAVYEGSTRLAEVRLAPRPKYYDLSTEDGIPYWKIALMHLDSMASTVLQTCAYWGNSDQCTFCGIGVSLAAGRTIAKKTPAMLAEVAVAARDLDGAVDATLTTGSTATPDRGALYVGKCAEAVKNASGLPVQVQFEPPEDLDVIDRVKDLGADSVGIHVETFDPKVLAQVAPGKARWGIEAYFGAWERAVKAFGEGQVSTYVILGMGEDPQLTIESCRRAVDIGVYPFIVPLRPVPGSLLADERPPAPEYVESIYREVVPYMLARGMTAEGVMAGCARCQACSGMAALERAGSPASEGGLADGRTSLPLFA